MLLAAAGLLRQDTNWCYADAGLVRVGGQPILPVWVVLLICIGCLGVMLAVTGEGRRVVQAMFAPGRRLRTAAVLLLLAFSLVPWEYSWVRPSRSQLVLYVMLASLGFVLLVIGSWRWLALPARGAQRLWGWLVGLNRAWFLLLCSGAVLVIALLWSLLVFEGIPHLPDSIAQLFQARIFAAGRLWLPVPEFPEFFDLSFTVMNHGRWVSVYPFFHSLLLTAGVLVGAPWLVNPLLGAAFVPLVFLLGREAHDETTGRGAALLAVVSPWLWAMSGEYMNHASALVLLTGFLVLALRSRRTLRWLEGFTAGLLLGLAACVRPYTALAFALPAVVFVLPELFRRRAAGSALALIGGVVLGGSLLLGWNWLAHGDPLLFGYVARYGRGHEIGFGHSGWGAAHTPLRGLVNVGHDLNMFNRFLLEWPVSSLLLVLLPLLGPAPRSHDRVLLFCLLALPLAYFFYWAHGVAFGPRFLYEGLGPALVLVTRGLTTPVLTADRRQTEAIVTRTLPLALVFALAVGLPPLVRWYRGYWGVSGRLQREIASRKLDNALVFSPEIGAVFNLNRLDLAGPVVYCRDLGPLNSALTVARPGRECWLVRDGKLVRSATAGFAQSALSVTLDSLEQAARQRLTWCRSVLWPLHSLLPRDSSVRSRAIDYHTVAAEIWSGRRRLEDWLPALALWVDGDPRPLPAGLSYLEKSRYYEAAGVDFRELVRVPGGRVFDIRPAAEP